MSPPDDKMGLGELQERLKGQWGWLSEALAPATSLFRVNNSDEDNWLRSKVRATRQTAEEALASAKSVASSTTDKVVSATSSVTGHLEGAKDKALELRRQNPGLMVAAVTALAVAPAYRSGSRALFRNAVVGGGAAAFFLYPEFIARTAPYVDRASLDVSKHARSTAERLGLMKAGGEQE